MSGIIGKNASRSSGVIGTAAAGIASLAADSSPQLGGFLDAAGNYIQMEKGGDISSASPTVIDTDGDYFAVTGTTNFSAFTVAADRHFFLEFGGALTMTHGAGTLDLPGAANITTAASDVGEFFSTAANVVTCVNYTKRDGTAVVLADNSITLAKMAGGTDGQIITFDASGDPVAVGPGSDGEVLTSTGAGSPPAFEAAAGGGSLTLISVQDVDAATVDFEPTANSYALADYTAFLFIFTTVWSDSGSAATLYMRISDDDGSSYQASNYGRAMHAVDQDAAEALEANAGSAAQWQLQDVAQDANDGVQNYAYQGSVWVPSYAAATTRSFQMRTDGSFGDDSGDDLRMVHAVGSVHAAADSGGWDSFQFFYSTGNVNGRISMYGFKDS
jgi:hypothetical protein